MNQDEPQTDFEDSGKPTALKDRLKWLTFYVGIICFIATYLRGYMYVNYVVHPEWQTALTETVSPISSLLLISALLATITLGGLTVPRWQGFFAFAVVLLTVWVGMSS